MYVKAGWQLRCVKETAYEMNEAELQLYDKLLRADLK